MIFLRSHSNYCEFKAKLERSSKKGLPLNLINSNCPDSVARLTKKLLVIRGEDDHTGIDSVNDCGNQTMDQ